MDELIIFFSFDGRSSLLLSAASSWFMLKFTCPETFRVCGIDMMFNPPGCPVSYE